MSNLVRKFQPNPPVSFCVKFPANKPTDRRRVSHNLLGGGNKGCNSDQVLQFIRLSVHNAVRNCSKRSNMQTSVTPSVCLCACSRHSRVVSSAAMFHVILSTAACANVYIVSICTDKYKQHALTTI